MSHQRITLREIIVRGTGLPDAQLAFAPGLNVVSGASDTGKSYIVECLDYALGASSPPRHIDEATGYETVALTFSVGDAQYMLERSTQGGPALLRDARSRRELETLGDVHAEEGSISSFLLGCVGLPGKQIRKNEFGEKRSLSFRDLARLVVIEEERIIGKGSPVFSGQVIHKTVEASVFKLLITGVDDSSVITKRSPKLERAANIGKRELLESLIHHAEKDVAPTLTLSSVEGQKQRLADALSAALARNQEAATELERAQEGRKEAWAQLQTLEPRRVSVKETLPRFELLRRHYDSDLERLEGIIEAESYLSRVVTGRCPVCGAASSAHDPSHDAVLSTDRIRRAAEQERAKVVALKVDLDATVEQLTREAQDLERKRDVLMASYRRFDTQIQERLKPSAIEGAQKVADITKALAEIERLDANLRHLETLRAEHGKATQKRTSRKKKEATASSFEEGVETQDTDRFCTVVAGLLDAWRYPGADRVTFSEKHQDLVIGGRNRATHGKGYRALSHAAFNVGLMTYAVAENRAHPGFVALDSPLVTLKEPDAPEEDAISERMVESFYDWLGKSLAGTQVIVFENDDPPFASSSIHRVHFSKVVGTGRYGFFPPRSP